MHHLLIWISATTRSGLKGREGLRPWQSIVHYYSCDTPTCRCLRFARMPRPLNVILDQDPSIMAILHWEAGGEPGTPQLPKKTRPQNKEPYLVKKRTRWPPTSGLQVPGIAIRRTLFIRLSKDQRLSIITSYWDFASNSPCLVPPRILCLYLCNLINTVSEV